MPSNIEIKAGVDSLATLRPKVEALAETGSRRLAQKDTFFRCPQGRLKLRVIDDGAGELIFYHRQNRSGPKACNYCLHKTAEPASLLDVLSQSYAIQGVVEKRRDLYWVGQTRVHLDRVSGLGEFVELEVVLQPGQAPDEGIEIAEQLMAKLDIKPDDLLEESYVDLLHHQQHETR